MTGLKSLFTLAVLLIATPVMASRTLCSFYPASDKWKLGIEFIGYDDESPMILFDLVQGPHSIPPTSYTLRDFNSKSRRVHLVYRNPGDPGMPPSFVLKGVGEKVVLTTVKSSAVGELRCGSADSQ